MFSTLLGRVLSLNQSSSGGMEGRKTGEGTAAWKKERVAGLSPGEGVLTFGELPLSLHPVGDHGPGQRSHKPAYFPKGRAEGGGLLHCRPQGERFPLLLQPASEGAERMRSAAGDSEHTQAPGMRGEEALTRPESRRRSALHGQGSCARPSAPVGSGLRYLRLCGPAPVRLRAPPRPRPRLRCVRLPPPEWPWGLRARSRRRRFDS